MTLFPFFMNIEGARGLITGNGKHALEKIQRILPYGPRLRVIAPAFMKEIEEISGIELVYREFQESDLDDKPVFVIAAGHDKEENHKIAGLCRKKGILVNVVDDLEYCDFIFPSLIGRGNLSIGICTNGASPATGVLLKRRICQQIPSNIEEILDFLQGKRAQILAAVPDKKKRFAFYYQLSQMCMEENRILEEDEFISLLKEI